MLNFSNSFSISGSADKSNIVIDFAQTYPKPFSDSQEDLIQESVGSFILSGDTALSLANTILEILSDFNIEEDSIDDK